MFNLPLLDKKLIAEKTYEISLSLSGQSFPFLAGQYIQVGIPNLLYPDSRGASRLFSIVSSPLEGDQISIAFRDSGSGFKRTILDLPLGTPLIIDGPFGSFTLPANQDQPLVLLAGGIGITPCLSLIRFATATARSGSLSLLYANRNEQSAAFLTELKDLAEQNQNFNLFSKFGLIDADFIQASIRDLDSVLWYVVGPEAMVVATKNILANLGVSLGRIYFEEFTGY